MKILKLEPYVEPEYIVTTLCDYKLNYVVEYEQEWSIFEQSIMTEMSRKLAESMDRMIMEMFNTYGPTV